MENWSKNGSNQLTRQMQMNARRRFGENHADLSKTELFPIPVLVAADKLDLIQSTLEPQSLRILCRTLRAIAHSYGASLLYTSRAHRGTLLKSFRARVTSHVMSSGLNSKSKPPAANIDHTTSLIQIQAGQDSFASIGEAPGGSAGSAGENLQLRG